MAAEAQTTVTDRYPRAFWGAVLAILVVQTGFGAILPLLPQFVHHRGFPVADMGLMAASYAAVSFVAQVGLGSAGDRVGRKFLLVAGTLIEAAGTAGFLLHQIPLWYIVCRVLQGLGSAAVVPAANALVADLVVESRRGRAYGLMAAAGSAGFAIGPMVGGLAGTAWGLDAPFAIGVVLNLAASGVSLLMVPPSLGRHAESQPHRASARPPIQTLWPYFWVMFAWTGMVGIYDTAWSLYMQWLGASKWVIGLSFSLFGLPLLFFNIYGGRLADRRHLRRWTILAGNMLQTMTVMVYIVAHSPWLAIAVSVVEAGAMSLTGPALSASVMENVPASLHGRVQGWFQASGTLGATLMALASGPLLVGAPNHPFILGCAVLLATTAGVAAVWRPWRTQSQKL